MSGPPSSTVIDEGGGRISRAEIRGEKERENQKDKEDREDDGITGELIFRHYQGSIDPI